jgi:ribosome-associated translation inhibitor RaiA
MKCINFVIVDKQIVVKLQAWGNQAPLESESTMKIDVRFLGMSPSQSLRDHSERQALLHLSRFGNDVQFIDIRISDVNGPKGGLDKQCRITARGPRFGLLKLEELSVDAYQAADEAIARLARTVGRQLERARHWKAGDPSMQRPN